MAKLLNWSAL